MMKISNICILQTSTIQEAMKVIGRESVKIVLIVDEENRLLGTLNDADIRRALLKGAVLSDIVNDIYHANAVYARKGVTKEILLNLCLERKVGQVPILDKENKVIDLFVLEDSLVKQKYKNHVVLMVGGLGTRLRPLTEDTPKPMLHVGGKPILQTIVSGFVASGFTNITMCLGYKSNVIQSYFKDGAFFGANIDYIIEDKRMGTAGALTLMKQKLDKPFFVMNGDLLTNIDYEKVLDFHKSNNSKATMCVREYDIEVPYGVIAIDNEKIVSIKEKPIHSFFVNAGVYILNVECINLIPKDEFYDMPTLFEKMILNGEKTTPFLMREYWLDVGLKSEYIRANQEYGKNFNE